MSQCAVNVALFKHLIIKYIFSAAEQQSDSTAEQQSDGGLHRQGYAYDMTT